VIGVDEIKNISRKVDENEKAITTLKNELQTLSKKTAYTPPLRKIETPIPIQSSVVLDQLTDTEIEVLEIIDDKGEASVPEIRRRINKTREHTARLLKKLYDKGFIDRSTNTMPYKYHIRKEIKETIQILKNKTSL
ncbi:MarR family transcriptional regulator, partial [Candidatus Bathyarchaeota archaeon]|nr:MarR family transcriptional regulator [Candidatus Bathyarchaeota archaeon]